MIRRSTGNLFKLIEGEAGALVMVGSALFALLCFLYAAVRGGRRVRLAGFAFLFLMFGMFRLRTGVSLFFGSEFTEYSS